MDEQRAIQLCVQHRDPVGFEFLVKQYRREAFAHAFAFLGNQEDALDACQDSFAKAFLALPGLRELPLFYPWFYCILRNRCLNLLARQRTADRYWETQEQEAGWAVEMANPEKLLESREDQTRVWRALGWLKAEHREILVMKYLQDHSYEEIAQIMGIPRGTVMSRLYHARVAFRETYLKLDREAARSSTEINR